VLDNDGVIYDDPVPTGEPPVETVYHCMICEPEDNNVTDPAPHLETFGAVGAVGCEFIIA
jgi:hypothetical protein